MEKKLQINGSMNLVLLLDVLDFPTFEIAGADFQVHLNNADYLVSNTGLRPEYWDFDGTNDDIDGSSM